MVILVLPVFIVPLPPCLGRDYGWACPWVSFSMLILISAAGVETWCFSASLLRAHFEKLRILFVTEPCFNKTGCICPVVQVMVLFLSCEVE